jgi:hypothetical protein
MARLMKQLPSVVVADIFFETLHASTDGGRYLANAETAGPWAPDLQHGGPPSALLVHSAERAVLAASGRTDLAARRIALDFIGAVPVGELEVRTRIVRVARSAALAEAVLIAGDRASLVGRVWFVAETDTRVLAPPPAAERPLPAVSPGLSVSFPYGESIEWLATAGDISTPGPGAVWARPLLDLVDGVEFSGLRLAAVVGDSASGISSELDWASWSFLNVDLDVHLVGPLRGDWVHMDAATTLGPTGSALARSTLSDRYGMVGATAQTLVVTPRRR